MGCSDSKIAEIETVSRSKERKTFIKQTISSHNDFSKSHFAYVTALKNMGPAFSDYAKGELHLELPRQPWEFFSMLMESDDKSTRNGNLVIRKKVVENERENVKFLEVFNAIDDGFVNASESAYDVSKILEVNKVDHRSNLADSRGHIDHSARVMRVITWNINSFNGQKIANDVKYAFSSEEKESLAAILDEMLAWENKLYAQFKDCELKKHEYEKKNVLLNKLTQQGASNDSLERTKATASHLHTRYIVEMQSIDVTVSVINRIRDEQLYPKLVQLVKEMHEMWENMLKQHENQLKVAQSLTSIKMSRLRSDISEQSLKSTQQFHLQVQIWCSEFEKLIKHQKEFIKSLNNWLKLNQSSKGILLEPQNRKIEVLLRTWQDELEKLSETKAKIAISNLVDVIEIIVNYRSKEMKQKQICEKTKRDIAKISREFEKWCDKQITKRIPSEEMDLYVIDDIEVIVKHERGAEALKRRLTAEEEEYRQSSGKVDEAVKCLYDGLPEVFTAVMDFSGGCANFYRRLKSHCPSVQTSQVFIE